jgi:hypothetical protein
LFHVAGYAPKVGKRAGFTFLTLPPVKLKAGAEVDKVCRHAAQQIALQRL